MSETPWGETYDDLADSVLRDPSSPIVLQLAAVKHRLGMPERLRELVAAAAALDDSERDGIDG